MAVAHRGADGVNFELASLTDNPPLTGSGLKVCSPVSQDAASLGSQKGGLTKHGWLYKGSVNSAISVTMRVRWPRSTRAQPASLGPNVLRKVTGLAGPHRRAVAWPLRAVLVRSHHHRSPSTSLPSQPLSTGPMEGLPLMGSSSLSKPRLPTL